MAPLFIFPIVLIVGLACILPLFRMRRTCGDNDHDTTEPSTSVYTQQRTGGYIRNRTSKSTTSPYYQPTFQHPTQSYGSQPDSTFYGITPSAPSPELYLPVYPQLSTDDLPPSYEESLAAAQWVCYWSIIWHSSFETHLLCDNGDEWYQYVDYEGSVDWMDNWQLVPILEKKKYQHFYWRLQNGNNISYTVITWRQCSDISIGTGRHGSSANPVAKWVPGICITIAS